MKENIKNIYLDNAGSTEVSKSAIEAAVKVSTEIYANPSAIHGAGIEAKNAIDESKEIIASIINATKEEIHFTSGGTESNNLAVMGAAKANKRVRNHIITTSIEHASLRNTVLALEDEGFEVTFLHTDDKGYVNLDELENSIKETTCLVSIMHVNNEIGTIQNIEKIGEIIKIKNKDTLFHVDGVQSFGKYDLNVKKARIDLLSMSGHKIHAMKGTGALYIRKGIKIKNLFFGGSQENGLRAGTENVPGIVSFATAAREMIIYHNDIIDKIKNIKMNMYNLLVSNISDLYLNGPSIEEGAYHILNIHIKGIKAAILINALSERGIYVSAGSACSAKSKSASSTLVSIGLKKEDIESSIRISFSRFTNPNDIEYVVKEIKENVDKIRKVSGYNIG